MRLQERLPSDEEIIDVEGDMFQFGTDEWRIRASSLIDGGQIGSSQINYYIRIPRRTLTHTHTLTHAYACAHTHTCKHTYNSSYKYISGNNGIQYILIKFKYLYSTISTLIFISSNWLTILTLRR